MSSLRLARMRICNFLVVGWWGMGGILVGLASLWSWHRACVRSWKLQPRMVSAEDRKMKSVFSILVPL